MAKKNRSYYATVRVYPYHDEELHVFYSAAERDNWVNKVGEGAEWLPGADLGYDSEASERQAITAAEARKLIAEDDNRYFESIVLHKVKEQDCPRWLDERREVYYGQWHKPGMHPWSNVYPRLG